MERKHNALGSVHTSRIEKALHDNAFSIRPVNMAALYTDACPL